MTLDPLPEVGREKRESLGTKVSRKALYTSLATVLTALAGLAVVAQSWLQDIVAERGHRSDRNLAATYDDLRDKLEKLTATTVANATEIRILRAYCPTRADLPPALPTPPAAELLRPLPEEPGGGNKEKK